MSYSSPASPFRALSRRGERRVSDAHLCAGIDHHGGADAVDPRIGGDELSVAGPRERQTRSLSCALPLPESRWSCGAPRNRGGCAGPTAPRSPAPRRRRRYCDPRLAAPASRWPGAGRSQARLWPPYVWRPGSPCRQGWRAFGRTDPANLRGRARGWSPARRYR